MRDEDASRLLAAAGESACQEHAPLEVDDARLAFTVAPADAEALGRVVRTLAERGLAAIICGGGSRLALGNPPARADLRLSTSALAGIELLDAEEGVVRAHAGTPLVVMRESAREAGWELPLDPPGAGSTLGGALAADAFGPRALAFGRARDLVLGLEVVLGSGERTRCGGRVVKNVTGYDLAKLYTGSLGSLGVLAAAWLRLRPLPEARALLAAALPAEPDPLARALDVARGTGARAVALLDPAPAGADGADGRGPLLVVELAGREPVVAARTRELESALGASAAPAALLEQVRALQGAEEQGGIRLRVDALAPRLASAAVPLARAGAALLVYPGLGCLWARFPADPADPAGARAVAAAREAARAGGGGWRLESAPLAAKRGRDVFGEAPEALDVMRALKARYDPAGVLNPGRFVGGL